MHVERVCVLCFSFRKAVYVETVFYFIQHLVVMICSSCSAVHFTDNTMHIRLRKQRRMFVLLARRNLEQVKNMNTNVISEVANSRWQSQAWRSGSLTGGLVPVGAYSDVVLLVALLGSCHLLHLSDFRHAKFGVVVEEHTTAMDGQVVLGPIPQLAQVLVVQRIEGEDPKRDRGKTGEEMKHCDYLNGEERWREERGLTLPQDAPLW